VLDPSEVTQLPVDLGPGSFRLQREQIERALADTIPPDKDKAFMFLLDADGRMQPTAKIVVAKRAGDSGWSFHGAGWWNGKRATGQVGVVWAK